MSAPTERDLVHDIFGSESELSDIDEPAAPRRPAPSVPRPARRPSPSASPEPTLPSGASGDEYKDDDAPLKKLGRIKKKRRDTAEGEAERVPGKPRRKRRRRAVSPPVGGEGADLPLPELTTEQKRRYELDQQIDSIVKPAKSTRRRRRTADDEGQDTYADEQVARLRERMITAAREDIEANENKQPATAKLRMLPDVMEVLQRSSLSQYILDNNLLESVKVWLEPLPDHSLPALNIQNSLFEALQKMYIDTASLKASELGKVILFYTKSKRVQPHIKRAADALVDTWSRPIIRRSANYRDLNIPLAEADSSVSMGVGRGEAQPSLARILAAGNAPGQRETRHVRVPAQVDGVYTVAPRGVGRPESGVVSARGMGELDEARERRKREQERLRRLQRKLQLSKAAAARV